MADEQQAPVIVRRQKPGAPPAFEQELDGRADRARAAFQAAHPEFFGPPQNPPITTETTALEPPPALGVQAPPAELPSTDDTTPAPVEEAAPASVPSPTLPAEVVAPETPLPRVSPPAPESADTPAIREMRAAIKRLQIENRQLQREREAAKKETPSPAEPQTAPPTDDDPFGFKAVVQNAVGEVEQRFAQREQERIQREHENEARRLAQELIQSEQQFAQTHPDYFDAVNHLIALERRRYQNGEAYADVVEMMGNAESRAQVQQVADNFVFVSGKDGELQPVRRDRLTLEQELNAREMSDTEAAVCLATDKWILDRRNRLIRNAQLQNKSVPEVAWELARLTGYQPRVQASATNGNGVVPRPNGTPPPASAASIRQQARVNAAARTLSTLSTGAPGEAQQQPIRSLAEFMDFQRRDPVGARRYIEQMSRIDPQWHRNLQA